METDSSRENFKYIMLEVLKEHFPIDWEVRYHKFLEEWDKDDS